MPSKLERIGTLSVADHDRDVTGMRYVYPVVSRRAGGVSIGVNTSTNATSRCAAQNFWMAELAARILCTSAQREGLGLIEM